MPEPTPFQLHLARSAMMEPETTKLLKNGTLKTRITEWIDMSQRRYNVGRGFNVSVTHDGKLLGNVTVSAAELPINQSAKMNMVAARAVDIVGKPLHGPGRRLCSKIMAAVKRAGTAGRSVVRSHPLVGMILALTGSAAHLHDLKHLDDIADDIEAGRSSLHNYVFSPLYLPLQKLLRERGWGRQWT